MNGSPWCTVGNNGKKGAVVI